MSWFKKVIKGEDRDKKTDEIGSMVQKVDRQGNPIPTFTPKPKKEK